MVTDPDKSLNHAPRRSRVGGPRRSAQAKTQNERASPESHDIDSAQREVDRIKRPTWRRAFFGARMEVGGPAGTPPGDGDLAADVTQAARRLRHRLSLVATLPAVRRLRNFLDPNSRLPDSCGGDDAAGVFVRPGPSRGTTARDGSFRDAAGVIPNAE